MNCDMQHCKQLLCQDPNSLGQDVPGVGSLEDDVTASLAPPVTIARVTAVTASLADNMGNIGMSGTG